MSTKDLPALNPALKPGDYSPAKPTDLRSPCPVVNALANHGYIPRDGRNIRAHELRAAMTHVGVGITLRHTLTYAAFLEHAPDTINMNASSPPPPPSLIGKITTLIRHLLLFLSNPFAYLLRTFALRPPNQVDTHGIPTLNLDQFSRHNAIEHDVSISRRDQLQTPQTRDFDFKIFTKTDNHTPQPDLIAILLGLSTRSDSPGTGGSALTPSDWALFRLFRIQQQKNENPHLDFGKAQDKMGLAENAFLQTAFGNRFKGGAVPTRYMKALFGEERLPVKEGWKKRPWWGSVGFVELTAQAWWFGKVVERMGAQAGWFGKVVERMGRRMKAEEHLSGAAGNIEPKEWMDDGPWSEPHGEF